MYPMGFTSMGIRAAQADATSARADAPVLEPTAAELRAERRAHRRRTRTARALAPRQATAGVLHRLAEAVAPGTGHPVR